ncbi:unnamed protein product [Prorocentrum cordatum]|uniref:Uncharacterized protein n=1 Tax=Prorocentrum cordatum TaxID=2364126 RepID=A0ABN9TDD8_9DINO|nr:unnamed protein product [Polarella glacialis]
MAPTSCGSFMFMCLACAGLALTWWCNLMMQPMIDMLLKPWVLLDSGHGRRVVLEFFFGQTANSTSTAACVSLLLSIGPIVITNCRATMGNLPTRLLFHYLGLTVAVAFSFPLQCALCQQPQRPPADDRMVLTSTLTIGGIGTFVLLGTRSVAGATTWCYVLTAVVPLIYDRLAATSVPTSLQALGTINMLVCAAFWANALWQQDGSPWVSPATASIFWDLAVVSICSCAWTAKHVGDFGLALLGLACPAACIPFAFARLAEMAAEGYVPVAE